MAIKIFGLAERQTTIRTEVLAGLTTFMTMAYIVAVNPLILSEAGMPIAGVAAATCLAAGIGSILMGLIANVPLALAGLVLVVANIAWISLLVSIASARFRDIPQIVASITQFAMFMTPVFWRPQGSLLNHALLKFNPELRVTLKKAGHLTRDPREKERKKAGQPGARKRFQFSKR